MRVPETGAVTVLGYTVVDSDAAAFDGELLHPVYSTPAVLRTMEQASRLALAPYLEHGETGAGREVHVMHRAPAPIGAEVIVTATIAGYTERTFTCRTRTMHGDRLIATGTVVQGILDADRFRSRYEDA